MSKPGMAFQNNSSLPFLGPVMPQNSLISHTSVAEVKESENGGSEAQITCASSYDYAYEFLQPFADRLEKAGSHLRLGATRCFSLEEVIRAVEVGEWG